ncbi:hypothetical protein SCLCIDRAFT_1218284 [Scleroderma citrinum Foug A]|uniref:Uncharacterized protein n=1 Tax=Scleroderma citrinum Foug A TaxID=1036808 RepID=A0A0C3DRV6_9AGAM|nr:hypothetical protein SCLCIDRAFT_1218284 [Scleroderma citrinum Foug A]
MSRLHQALGVGMLGGDDLPGDEKREIFPVKYLLRANEPEHDTACGRGLRRGLRGDKQHIPEIHHSSEEFAVLGGCCQVTLVVEMRHDRRRTADVYSMLCNGTPVVPRGHGMSLAVQVELYMTPYCGPRKHLVEDVTPCQ